MGNVEYKRNYVFGEKEDDSLKEEYVQELGKALQNYMRTGVKNSQLDNLAELKNEFHNRYKERFKIDKIIEAIEASSREKMQKNISQLDTTQNAEPDTARSIVPLYEELMITSVSEVLRSQLEKVLLDTSYLSHMNMLYELYAQEEKLRREEREFADLSSKFHKLADISEKLSQQRRIELQDLQEQSGMSYEELTNMLGYCQDYFNIRNTKDKVVVSLSPEGRKYRNYINSNKGTYSEEVLNRLIYKNCNNVIDGLRKSYNSGIKHELQLDGLEPDSRRAVRSKYFEALKDFLEAPEILYVVSDDSDIMERSDENYGKYKVRICGE